MKIGFIYAGQGQQFTNMGLDFISEYPLFKGVVEQASSLINVDIQQLFSDEALLFQTKYTQPAILTFSYAITQLLKEKNIKPAVVAGLSLGEYNALLACNALTFEQALPLIKERALIMSDALPNQKTGMAAVLKADATKINNIIKEHDLMHEVAICNYNTNDQVVIGGLETSLDELITLLKEAGFKRIIKLNVSLVSHMSLLLPASHLLKTELNKVTFNKPKIPFINNIEAKIQEDDFSTSLALQIAYPTLMASSITLMLQKGVDTFIEIGPGSANSGFVKSLAKELNYDVQILSIDDVAKFKNVVEKIGELNE